MKVQTYMTIYETTPLPLYGVLRRPIPLDDVKIEQVDQTLEGLKCIFIG